MKTIVVAEGFQNSRKVIVNALARNGYNTIEATDGQEALELFDGRTIDLVITDYKLSNMNGAELAEAIRKKIQYKYIPVLVLSAETNHSTNDDASGEQLTAWVTKPFELERFMKLVKRSVK